MKSVSNVFIVVCIMNISTWQADRQHFCSEQAEELSQHQK